MPVGQIYRAPELMADEHVLARESIVSVTDPRLGNVPMQNVFPRLSATPGAVRHTGPALGEHNDEVFRDILRISEERLAELRTHGVI